MIVVPSVHHTGTKLVFDEILRDVPSLHKQRIHMEPKFLDWLHGIIGTGAQIIVPLRHPRIVAIGWKLRAKRLEELDEQWKILKEEIDPYNPYYLPIEHEDRDKWLAQIATGIGRSLGTNWPVIGACPAPVRQLNDKDEWMLASWMEDGFFARFDYT